jgi:hypothetical protein
VIEQHLAREGGTHRKIWNIVLLLRTKHGMRRKNFVVEPRWGSGPKKTMRTIHAYSTIIVWLCGCYIFNKTKMKGLYIVHPCMPWFARERKIDNLQTCCLGSLNSTHDDFCECRDSLKSTSMVQWRIIPLVWAKSMGYPLVKRCNERSTINGGF